MIATPPSCARRMLKPAAPFEPSKRNQSTERNHGQAEGLAADPIQLGHVLEVHPINPRHKHRRDSDNRDNGKNLKDVVLPDADEPQDGVEPQPSPHFLK